MDKYNSRIAKIFGFFNRSKRFAVTFGQTAYYSVSKEEVDKSPKWRKHEDRHKEQWKEEGRIKFLFKYIWYSITKGYQNNPYEIDARNAENK
jgi:hypothetical protein